jgi:hypothetical protein
VFNLKKTSITLCTSFFISLTVLHSSYATKTHATQAPTTETSPPKALTLYDKPLSEKHLPLPRDPRFANDPDFANQKIEVACFYYSGFMVKEQVDSTNKGADKLAITPFDSTLTPPICQSEATADEKIISGNSDRDQDRWNGYFMGTKGPYVFFSADDGNLIGGMNFAVFDGKDGKQLFTDGFGSGMDHDEIYAIQLNATDDLSLHYKRTYRLPCSPSTKNNAANLCQKRIKQETGLRSLPSCARKYREGDGIHYPVNVLLEKAKQPKLVPTQGKATCVRAL